MRPRKGRMDIIMLSYTRHHRHSMSDLNKNYAWEPGSNLVPWELRPNFDGQLLYTQW
eukprot:UN08841